MTQTKRSRSPLDVYMGTHRRVPHAVYPLSATIAKNRMGNAHVCAGRRLLHAPTAIGGIADGVRRSTADTLGRG